MYVIDHPLANDDPNAILVVNPQVFLSSDFAVIYRGAAQGACPANRWQLGLFSGAAIPDGTKFSVLIAKP